MTIPSTIRSRKLLAAAGLLLAALAPAASGCQEAQDSMPPIESTQAALTYHRDIKPVMERYCTTCHKPGDIAPFALTDYESAKRHAGVISNAVTANRMPPWMPSDAGLPMRYSRKMRPEDKKLLLDWVAAGAPEGDPAAAPRSDIPPAETVAPPRPDMVLQAPKPYAPVVGANDDYHCFAFDPKLDHDRYLLAGQVKPDYRPIVHHMVVFLVSPTDAPKVQQMDTGSGYTCFGGPGKNIGGAVVLAWAPGGTPMRTPEGTAFKIPKGAVLVMQVHYNLTAYTPGKTDRSSIDLEFTDTPPAHEIYNLIMAQPKLMIKAGDANSHQSADYPVSLIASRLGIPSGELTVLQTFPHMHLLGRRIALSITDGPTLIEIPRWDFHWQETYSLQKPFTLRPSDGLHIDCTYDNSTANQPVIDGQQQPARDVTWGENTQDEMCVALLLVTKS